MMTRLCISNILLGMYVSDGLNVKEGVLLGTPSWVISNVLSLHLRRAMGSSCPADERRFL